MDLRKQRNRCAVKCIALLVLSTFVMGIVPAGHTAEDLIPGEEKAFAQDILAENVLLTIKLSELDVPPEEKLEILGNALGWEFPNPETAEGEFDAITAATPRVCNQYLQIALILDTIDFFFPPLFIVTSFYYLGAVLCYLGVI
jgi:hypothetical protein